MSTQITVVVNPSTDAVAVAIQQAANGASAYQSYLANTADSPPLSEAAWSAPAGSVLGGGAQDAVGIAANEDGGLDLVLWNETRQLMQRVRITGLAGSERLIFIPIL